MKKSKWQKNLPRPLIKSWNYSFYWPFLDFTVWNWYIIPYFLSKMFLGPQKEHIRKMNKCLKNQRDKKTCKRPLKYWKHSFYRPFLHFTILYWYVIFPIFYQKLFLGPQNEHFIFNKCLKKSKMQKTCKALYNAEIMVFIGHFLS